MDELTHNVSYGIIRSNLSLVLQRVTKHSSGNYVCVASNALASSSSNKLRLNVKFRPVCSPNQKLVYGGGRHEPVHISCSVEALPMATKFRWAFNTSTELVDLPQGRAKNFKGKSVVTYLPKTHLDYGSLLCWGINEVGRQLQPCVFQVVPAGPPEPPKNCSAWHEMGAASEMTVACISGRDGGLPQRFSLEVSKQGDGAVLLVVRDQQEPRFSVTSLKPGTDYILKIIASNTQGTAPPVTFNHFTPIDIAEERMSASAAGEEEDILETKSLIAIIGGIIGAFIITFTLLLIVLRIKKKRRHPLPVTRVSEENIQKSFIEESTGISNNPDVILASEDGNSPGKEISHHLEKNVKFNLEKDYPRQSSYVLLRPLSLSSTQNLASNIFQTPATTTITESSSSSFAPSSLKPTMPHLSASSSAQKSSLPNITKPLKPLSTFSASFLSNSPSISEVQPLLMMPPIPPAVSFRDPPTNGNDLPLPLHQELSPPEEFSTKGSFTEVDQKPKHKDSPQIESAV